MSSASIIRYAFHLLFCSYSNEPDNLRLIAYLIFRFDGKIAEKLVTIIFSNFASTIFSAEHNAK